MKIAILSRKPSLYSTRRLKEAAEARGHVARVVDYLRCYMNISSTRPRVIYQGRELEGFDAVIPRIGASNTFYGTAVVRQFEMIGVFAVNDAQAIASSRDKLRCLQILAGQGIALPTTGFAHSIKDVAGLVDCVGGAPLVVKLLEGTQGIGVVLCETEKAAASVIEAFRGLDANILVQQFIAEAGGADVRAFVVGEQVIAAMSRQAAPGEFRSNLHRGGTARATKLSEKEREIAVAAAKATGLRVSGVDLMRAQHGPVVLEVNSSPGLQGIENATKKDVAGAIIEFIEKEHAEGPVRGRVNA